MATLTIYDGAVNDTQNSGASGAYLMQSFKIANPSTITGIGMKGSQGFNGGIPPSGTFAVEIRDSTYNGTVLKTETFNTSILPSYTVSPTMFTINFTTSFNITDATKTYFLGLKPLTGSSNDEIRWSADTSGTYPDGSEWDSAGNQYTTRDNNFAIYGNVTPTFSPSPLMHMINFAGL